MDRHLELAIAQMEKVQATYEDEPELASAVAEEITVLKSRLANNQDGPTLLQPTSWGKFWS
jgi:hypothetical protein